MVRGERLDIRDVSKGARSREGFLRTHCTRVSLDLALLMEDVVLLFTSAEMATKDPQSLLIFSG